jgi:hypothetical protein
MLEQILELHIDSPIVNYELYKFIFHVYVETEKSYNSNTERFLLKMMIKIKRTLETLFMYNWGSKAKFHYLSHKELVGENQVMIDLANICIQNLNFFINEVCKDSSIKLDENIYIDFVKKVYTMYEYNRTDIKNDFL